MNEHTDPITSAKMTENADCFENKAIAVQEAAESDDKTLALMNVDGEYRLFGRATTILDIAIVGEC